MTDFGAQAFQHIRILAQNIGPRPAGSPAERQAFDYVAGQLESWGYSSERQPIRFAPLPQFFPLYALGGLIVVVASWGVGGWPWLTMWLPLLILALPQLARWLIRRRLRTEASANILTYTADSDAPTLILCAHMDSARASFFQNRNWLWLQGKTMFVVSRLAVAVALFSLLGMFGFNLPVVNLALGLIGTLAGGWWAALEVLNQLAHHGRFSPGAHDNASGVGVMLALAEHFARHPPANARLGFLFTGAEETGLHGAEAFVSQPDLPDFVRVLNFDMVGAGNELCLVTGDGTLRPLKTDSQLNALIQKAHSAVRRLWYAQRSGDFAAFLQCGIPAASLQTSGSEKAELTYHTVNDTIEVIDEAALQMTAEAVVKVVDLIQRFGP